MKRVLVTTAYGHWGRFSPHDLYDPLSTMMIGGGETAMMHLAFQLARLGCDVKVCYDTARPIRYRGVDFIPKALGPELACTMESDLLLSWEDVSVFGWNHKAAQTVLAMQTNTIMLGSYRYAVDRLQAVSQWHIDTLVKSDPSFQPADMDKWLVIPNGVDPGRYPRPDSPVSVIRHPHRIVHSSSPDRGLHHLLRAWPDIRTLFPDAELHIFYELNRWFDIVDSIPETPTKPRADEIRTLLAQYHDTGVVVRGPVNQLQLAQEHMAAGLLVYPCDTIDKATEGFGITILEALMAGTPVITTDCDAFPELWSGAVEMLPLPLDGNTSRVVDAVEKLWKDSKLWNRRSREGREFAQRYTWDVVGDRYYQALFGDKEVTG